MRGLLLALMQLMLLLPAFAQPEFDAKSLNSVVVTFSPPVINGINCSEDLFQTLLVTMRDKPADLAMQIDSAGAVWSASNNLSGVQFALFYPGNSSSAIAICKTLLSNLVEKIPELLKITGNNNFANHLHSICNKIAVPPYGPRFPVTLHASGEIASHSSELRHELIKFAPLYDLPQPQMNASQIVIPAASSTVYEIFSWNTFTPETFFSAKFIGEQFIRKMAESTRASYEILFGQTGISLALIMNGSEEELCNAKEKAKKFIQLQSFNNEHSVWQNFSRRAAKILRDDLCDLRKKTLFEGWASHWGGNFAIVSEEPTYASPTAHIRGVSHPEGWKHDFSFSANSFPRVSACSLADSADLADIAIAIETDPAIINELVTKLDDESTLPFPITLDKQSTCLVVISFLSPVDQIGEAIANLKSLIMTELPGQMQIGIAGASKLAPFELRGLLQQGWATPATQSWQQATLDNLTEILLFSPHDQSAFNRRWAIATSTSRGRATILALLATKNRMLKNFFNF